MAGITIGSLSDFNEATAAYRRSAGRYLIEESPAESGDPGIQDNEAEGVDGTGTVIGGFRGRTVGPFVVCYVAASREACLEAFETDRDALEAEQVPDGVTVSASSGTDYEIGRASCRERVFRAV